MKINGRTISTRSVARRYRAKLVLGIALIWTLIDTAVYVYKFYSDHINSDPTPFDMNNTTVLGIRLLIIFCICLIMASMLVYKLKSMVRNFPLWVSLLTKLAVLLASAFILNMLLHLTYVWLLEKQGVPEDLQELNRFYYRIFQTSLFRNQLLRWFGIFLVTILFLEINEKYSPGVFLDILSGKYINPKVENRIIMFIDLADSTTIAENLDNKKYFRFIRDFIYYTSVALIENNGQIYQYVGDEIVVSWPYKNYKSTRKCLQALLDVKKMFQQRRGYFKRHYGVIPEFRVGVHIGEVTVGEIGVVKKDLAMSGDIMNTTARIRSSCRELNQHYVVSKEFIDATRLKESQMVSLGMVDLKGKETAMELYALKL